LSFLQCRLTKTKKVTHDDKRDFGITPPVNHKQPEINTNEAPIGQEVKRSNEYSNKVVQNLIPRRKLKY